MPTAFRCPWPNCGRAFNVNSNMRRHHRNHTTPGFSRPHPPTRRARPPTQTQSKSQSHSQSRSPAQAPTRALPSRRSYDSGSAEDELEGEGGDEEEEDELDEDSGMDVDRREEEENVRERYSQSHVRGRGREGEGVYAASAPYGHSFADMRVSTALRPAFHAPTARRGVKVEAADW